MEEDQGRFAVPLLCGHMTIAVVGAGLAGLACATRLTGAGHRVVVYDKGRVPGGRCSTRTIETVLGPVCFDHGAQYFTAREAAFQAQVDQWRRAGVVAPWPAAGQEAWVGLPGMNAPALALAAALEVQSSFRVDALRRDPSGWYVTAKDLDAGPFEAVVCALPAEQTRALVAPWDASMEVASGIASDPCWTVMAAFEGRVPVTQEVFKQQGILDWAARNSAKPGRSGPEAWVMHATPAWSRSHLEDPADDIGPSLLAALSAIAGGTMPQAIVVAAHRWRFARSGRLGRPTLWNSELKLGVCGDWLLGPRVECAWVSGDRLGEQICAAG